MASPYSFEEVVKIDRHEIYPVLITNKQAVAGTWDAFEPDSLIKAITERLNKKSWADDLANSISYFLNNWMNRGNWKRLRKTYDQLRN